MQRTKKALVIGSALFVVLFTNQKSVRAAGAHSADEHDANSKAMTVALDSMDGLDLQTVLEEGSEPVKSKSGISNYRGRNALHVTNEDGPTSSGGMAGGEILAVVKASDFGDGTIEADIAAMPREGAPPGTRGFVGIAFRVRDHASHYECIYLRMTNGRAEDQLQRNHSTQYASQPDFPWYRLRKENPGVYESYVDLEAGAWVKIRIVVAGTKALLYVNNAPQPTLVVNDLKLGNVRGQIALWTGSGTDAHFSNLIVR